MTLTEVVVSAVILGISSQVSLQGWSRTSQAAASSARTDQQVRLLEQRLLASRRALARAPIADDDCRWNHKAVAVLLENLPENADLETSWSFDSFSGWPLARRRAEGCRRFNPVEAQPVVHTSGAGALPAGGQRCPVI